MKKFCEQFVCKFDTHKNSKLAKISILKFMLKQPFSINIWQIPTNQGSEFKLDSAEFKNNYVLLIDVHNFE